MRRARGGRPGLSIRVFIANYLLVWVLVIVVGPARPGRVVLPSHCEERPSRGLEHLVPMSTGPTGWARPSWKSLASSAEKKRTWRQLL